MARKGDVIRAIAVVITIWAVMALTGCKEKEAEAVQSDLSGPITAAGVTYADLSSGIADGTIVLNQDILDDNEWEFTQDVLDTPDITFETEADEIVLDQNMTAWGVIDLDLDWEMPTTLTICTETGGELVLDYGGDELIITGDADMNEAAQIFFNEALKPIVDEYIRSQAKL